MADPTQPRPLPAWQIDELARRCLYVELRTRNRPDFEFDGNPLRRSALRYAAVYGAVPSLSDQPLPSYAQTAIDDLRGLAQSWVRLVCELRPKIEYVSLDADQCHGLYNLIWRLELFNETRQRNSLHFQTQRAAEEAQLTQRVRQQIRTTLEIVGGAQDAELLRSAHLVKMLRKSVAPFSEQLSRFYQALTEQCPGEPELSQELALGRAPGIRLDLAL